jgi:hypothetical protein
LRFAPYELFCTAILALAIGLGLGFGFGGTPVVHSSSAPAETIYIQNHSPRNISDATIRHDIPAWEQAANVDFSRYWGTPRVKLVFIQGRAPAGAVVATFKSNGPISGAVAFHGVFKGVPGIVIYTGVAGAYNFSDSLAFTHELFELLADRSVSQLNWAWPSPAVYLGHTAYQYPSGAIFVNEACDPVERLSYRIHGVVISDFVTPNWFNDQIKGEPYDFMGLVPQAFTILHGGYAMYVVGNQVFSFQYFEHAGKDAAAFYKGERIDR